MADIESVELAAGASPVEPKHEREGLPPGYRMRADAHYVDQLTSRRADRLHADALRTDAAPPRGDARRDVVDREPAGDAPHRRHERVFAQLTEDLATITSAAALLGGESSAVARRVNLDLIRAHAWRATWLNRAHQMLEGLHRTHVRSRALGPLLARLREGLEAEGRLTGSTIDVDVPDWNATVEIDDESLLTGIAGAILATLSLTSAAEPLAVRVTAALAGGDLRTIEVTQDAVQAGASHEGRGRDAAWSDRHAGWTSSLGAMVAKTAGHLAGAEVAFLGSERRGSTVRFTFKSGR